MIYNLANKLLQRVYTVMEFSTNDKIVTMPADYRPALLEAKGIKLPTPKIATIPDDYWPTLLETRSKQVKVVQTPAAPTLPTLFEPESFDKFFCILVGNQVYGYCLLERNARFACSKIAQDIKSQLLEWTDKKNITVTHTNTSITICATKQIAGLFSTSDETREYTVEYRPTPLNLDYQLSTTYKV